ncbi:B3 domain-containing protein At1g49475 [Spinacia oleracea]|uniref:B3 domain-containing protein At1g49475 n=1 Tax=Spinacia oleracea TaxID=3562 RepID=A0A9R0K2F3_SPIOL|nr:B3 domain-containing protein At1g49475-like [Spinacia oleracea]
MVEEKKKRRREEEGKPNDELKFKINPNKFFKLILPHILEQNSSLRIPETFAKKFTPQIRTFATLATRTGLPFKIVVERIENGLYFTERWAKFMEYNHIKYGYFLEFAYEGNSHFKVYIFDLSCTEIEYPVVELDQHANQKVPRNRNRDGKSKENQEAVEEEEEAEKDKHKDGVVLESNRHNINPSFSIVVRNCSLLRGGAYLHIPTNFTKEHMEGGHLFKYVMLEGDDGRDWCIDCYFCHGVGLRLNGPRWRKFVLRYDWEEGDTYTFELVDKKQDYATFKVSKM